MAKMAKIGSEEMKEEQASNEGAASYDTWRKRIARALARASIASRASAASCRRSNANNGVTSAHAYSIARMEIALAADCIAAWVRKEIEEKRRK